MAHKDEVKGKIKEMAGKVEQEVGRARGDEYQATRGAAREGEGKAQGSWVRSRKMLTKSLTNCATRQFDRRAGLKSLATT